MARTLRSPHPARLPAWLLLAVVAAVGCNDNHHLHGAGGEIVSAPPGAISTYQLAGRLGMRVVESSSVTATLADSANTVVLYADPRGQAYVNSRVIDAKGATGVGDMLFVPEPLVERIRASMRPAEPTPRPRPRPQPTPTPRPTERLGTVVIDPGHGGRDPGAIAVTGIEEKAVALAVSLRTAELLRTRGVNVIMTRTDDTYIPLDVRADIANEAGADLFVSIHADSAENPSARGFTVYVARAASRDSHRAAQAVLGRLENLPSPSRGVRQADYRVLVRTAGPAMLIELGYLSNAREARMLADPAYQQRLAQAIADGIVQHFQR